LRGPDLRSKFLVNEVMNMRSKAHIIALLLTATILLSAAGAWADRQSESAAPKKADAWAKGQQVLVTGSHIPVQVYPDKRISNGPQNVTVINRAAIERSGASSVAQVLARVPGIRVRGN
jgi:outer membrane cobalamin receptor